MRVENKLPASYSSAGTLAVEMVRAVEATNLFSPGIRQRIESTWEHELAHFNNDSKKSEFGGEFGYELAVGLTDGRIIASWIAYYRPFGPDLDEDPERWANIAKAQGFGEMSLQDKKIYEASLRQWSKMMQEERIKAREDGKVDEKGVSLVPALIGVPRRDDEKDDEYKERVKLVEGMGKIIDELLEQGEIPTLTKIYSGNENEFADYPWDKLVWVYRQACKELEEENSSESNEFDGEMLDNRGDPTKKEESGTVYHQGKKTRDSSMDESLCASNFSSECQLHKLFM